MKRLFLAVDFAIPVVEQLVLVQEELTSELEDTKTRARWTAPENIHLTLNFFGDTEPALLPLLIERLDRVARPLFPFQVECLGLGCFPSPDNPRILWAGVDQRGGEVLDLLKQTVDRELEELGFESDPREFKPHITLGRIKSREKPDFSDFVDRHQDVSFGKSFIKDFVLFESRLTADGPLYEVITRAQLGDS